jgi:hypothetical protein
MSCPAALELSGRMVYRPEFFRHFTDRGYVIRDRWSVPEISMEIPFHPEGFVSNASCFCAELVGASRR